MTIKKEIKYIYCYSSESSGIGHFTWRDRMVGTTESNASWERNKPEQKDKRLHPFPNHRPDTAEGLVGLICHSL